MSQFQFVGVDVAKAKFDAALFLDNIWLQHSFGNDKKGYRAFYVIAILISNP